MKKDLFGQNIDPSCAYCENYIFEKDAAYCRKGKEIKNGKCRHFRYDPLMRVPTANAPLNSYSAEDFKL